MSTYLIVTSWLVLFLMTLTIFSKDNAQERSKNIKALSEEQLKLAVTSFKAVGIAFIIIMGSFWVGSGLTVSNQMLQFFIAFNFTYMIHKFIRGLNNLKARRVKVYVFDKFLAGVNYGFVIWFIITNIIFN